jgi:methenyltetrahydromethanopterin cyclohydrolase
MISEVLSVNERAVKIVQRMIADADALELAVTQLDNGTTVVDAGVRVPGSLEAGRLFAEVCLGGLGKVRFCELDVDGMWLPGVTVSVSHPPVACMAAQYAGWAVKGKKFFAMGSGPARALYRGEPLFEQLDYRDQADVAVLALEGRKLPPEEAAEKVAAKCQVSPDRLYLLVAPTASLVGSVQVAARVVETGLHKMLEVGFDLGTMISGFGTCPLAPIAKDDLRAIGRTNDAVLYGGRAWYTVRADDAQIEPVIEQLPSSASRDYGTPFYDLFQRYDGDFYKIDPLLFSPAEVAINNVTSGRTFRAGGVNAEMIQKALLE